VAVTETVLGHAGHRIELWQGRRPAIDWLGARVPGFRAG
jgi:hypothetical protein